MSDIDKLSDAELRTKLIEHGFPVMPITGTTRKVMVKKLKLLAENKGKIASQDRRSLARYSSEEESDTDAKASRKTRRQTMAAPVMPAPSASKVTVRKSRRHEEEDTDSEVAEVPVVKMTTASTRTSRIVQTARDEFDTGSESESDIKKLDSSASGGIKYNSSPLIDTSFRSGLSYSPGRYASSSFASPASSSSFAPPVSDPADRLNQIRSRLSLGARSSAYERPTYESPSPMASPERGDNIDAPFLSNFTKRLSQLSAANSPRGDYDYKNDVIKEHDTNGASGYAAARTSYLPRAYRARELSSHDYLRRGQGQSNIIKNNLVSFAVLGVAILFFIVIGVMYLGIRNDSSAIEMAGYSIPYCGSDAHAKRGVNCLLDGDVVSAINVLKVIKPELVKRIIGHTCSDAAVKPFMNETEIVRFIHENYAMEDFEEIGRDLTNLEVLIFNNPSWGVSVVRVGADAKGVSEEDLVEDMDHVLAHKASETTSSLGLAVVKPTLPWRCSIYRKLSVMVNVSAFATVAFFLLYAANYAYKYYRHWRQKRRDELFLLVERIIDILQSQAAENDSYVVINHVRDMILPINDRKRMENVWKEAVGFVNENESRVRTELQVVRGETYEVWRWVGGPDLSATSGSSPARTKTWQGQAFETQTGSVNSLPCSPTPCLKIRGMVDEGDRNLHTIREAVLSKCAHQCRILHCEVDTVSKCVYLKCADQEDAAVAYRNLHGWWYAGHLVTVKYLRLKRYNERYPSSAAMGPPFLKALAPATDWTS